jgi:uncharacterized alpha-E superfamily protein
MLSRTADQLYWMARYVERAENIARILEVSYRMSLMPEESREGLSIWGSAVQIGGDWTRYNATYGAVVNRQNVMRHMALDAHNTSSIFSCIQAARENARELRGSITTEMFESLNATWIDIRDIDEPALAAKGYQNFFDWVKERSNLFRGVIDGTLLRDESHHFIDLGDAIERADNTARLLDGKYHVLLPTPGDVGGALDYYQWGAVLRAVSAFRAYHRIYRNVITPERVAELLILRADMPRSLHASFNRITETLDLLCGRRIYECRRQAGEVHARLHYGRMSDIFRSGLHEFLNDFLQSQSSLAVQMQRDFLMIT